MNSESNKLEEETQHCTFTKNERLCSQRAIEQLFAGGKALYYFPFRLVYSLTERVDDVPVKIAISVPKKIFKRAVKRNAIKRRIREAYRHNKGKFYSSIPANVTINLMLIYVSPNLAAYSEIETKLVAALGKLAKSCKEDKHLSLPSSN